MKLINAVLWNLVKSELKQGSCSGFANRKKCMRGGISMLPVVMSVFLFLELTCSARHHEHALNLKLQVKDPVN